MTFEDEAEERALEQLATTFPNEFVEPRRRPIKDPELDRVRKLDTHRPYDEDE